nr:MerR family transcriptional regulator [Nocardia tengchongensis]
MDDETLYPIGALAERTGLTVKTIRFYSDKGIVPPTTYSPAATGSTTSRRWPDWNWFARSGNWAWIWRPSAAS